jgi:AcrR family transcriptional regulator
MPMKVKKRDAAKSRAAIVAAARRLFARRSIAAVSIRDIAREAGVSHGLVQQYFGNRKNLIAAIIRSEIEQFATPDFSAGPDKSERLEGVRNRIRTGLDHFRDYAMLITRAELAGVKPGTMLDPKMRNPAMELAGLIAQLQAEAPAGGKRMDPRLVSAYINASLFAFATISPWLMASVGLKPRDLKARFDEIADLSVGLITLAIGPGPKARRRGAIPKRRGGSTESRPPGFATHLK